MIGSFFNLNYPLLQQEAHFQSAPHLAEIQSLTQITADSDTARILI